jgi:hypothetical protein
VRIHTLSSIIAYNKREPFEIYVTHENGIISQVHSQDIHNAMCIVYCHLYGNLWKKEKKTNTPAWSTSLVNRTSAIARNTVI